MYWRFFAVVGLPSADLFVYKHSSRQIQLAKWATFSEARHGEKIPPVGRQLAKWRGQTNGDNISPSRSYGQLATWRGQTNAPYAIHLT